MSSLMTQLASLTVPVRTAFTAIGEAVDRLVRPEPDALARPTVASITTYSTTPSARGQSGSSEGRTAR